MGRYADAYAEFTAKYDLDLNIQTEYNGADQLVPIEDFSVDISPEVKAQNVYMSTLTSALTSYIGKKLKIESGKSRELANFNVRDFVTEFDKVINAIRSDNAEKANTEYTHRKFEGMPLDRVANEAWARVAPICNKTLPTLWMEQMKSGRLKIEDARMAAHSLYEKLTAGDAKKEELSGELKNYVAAREAMRKLRESRKGFFGAFWKFFHREQNKQEKDLLGILEAGVNELQGSSYNYDVDGIFYEATRETIRGEDEFYRTGAEDLSADKRAEEKLVIQDQEKAPDLMLPDDNRVGLNADQLDQLKTDIEGKKVETKSLQVEAIDNPIKEKTID